MIIYKIQNLINNKIYIGQTNNFKRRIQEHISSTSSLIGQAIHKYGKDNFTFEIIFESTSQEEINQKEVEMIELFKSIVPNGYNIQLGGLNNSTGEKNPNASLNNDEVKWILENRKIQQKELYDMCPFKEKISYNHFRQIYNGKFWSHIKSNVIKANNLSHPGEQSGSAKYTNQEVYEIRENYAKGIHYTVAWELSGKKVTLQSFYNIYNGTGYNNVHMDVYTNENRKKHRPDKNGENNGRAKLTKENVLEIRELSKTKTVKEISTLFPQVTITTLRDIINYRTWKNI